MSLSIGLLAALSVPDASLLAQTPASAAVQPPPSASAAPVELPLFPLRVRWSADLGVAPSAGAAGDDQRVYVPLSGGGLVAVIADSGTTVWRAEVTTTVSPVAADGRVYVVGADALDALDASSGRAIWRVPLPAAVSAPLVARGGWVVVALANGEVAALRGSDGTIVWRQTAQAPLIFPPAINGDRLYLPGADGIVRALTINDGATIWTQDIGSPIVSVSPLGSRVYAGATDNYFYCLDDERGRVRWRWRTGSDPIGSAVADEERVYFSSLDTIVRALDRGHGAQRWRRPLPWRPRSGPQLVGHTLVLSGVALDLRGYAIETGQPVGEFALTPDRLELLEGAPVLVPRETLPGDFLVVAIADGRLLALEHVFGLPGLPLTVLPGEPVALTPPLPPS